MKIIVATKINAQALSKILMKYLSILMNFFLNHVENIIPNSNTSNFFLSIRNLEIKSHNASKIHQQEKPAIMKPPS